LGRPTKLQVHARPLDVALGHLRVQLNALGEVIQGLTVLALEAAEGAAQIVRVGLVLVEVAQLQGLLESLGGLLIAGPRLALQGLETLLELALASLLRQFHRILQTGRPRLVPKALEVVADECGAGEPGRLGLEDLLGLGLGELLEQTLDGLGALLVPEPVDDAARGEVEKRLAVLAQVVVGVGAAVEGLDVLGVEVDGSSGVLDNLVPVAQGIVAGSAVGVIDRIRLAQNGLGVEPDCLLKVLGTVRLVAGLLQLLRVLLALCLGKALDGGLVDLREFVGGLDRGSLGGGCGGGGLGRLCRRGCLGGFCLPLGLLPFPPLLLAGSGCCVLGFLGGGQVSAWQVSRVLRGPGQELTLGALRT
jgi:hypothetical protein